MERGGEGCRGWRRGQTRRTCKKERGLTLHKHNTRGKQLDTNPAWCYQHADDDDDDDGKVSVLQYCCKGEDGEGWLYGLARTACAWVAHGLRMGCDSCVSTTWYAPHLPHLTTPPLQHHYTSKKEGGRAHLLRSEDGGWMVDAVCPVGGYGREQGMEVV